MNVYDFHGRENNINILVVKKLNNCMYVSRHKISDIYSRMQVIEEGIEEKIPKLLGMVPLAEIPMGGFSWFIKNDEDKASLIKWLADNFDPTPTAVYITWLIKMAKSGIIRMEDGDKYKEILARFTELKLKPQFPSQFKDINRFKSFGDLAEVVTRYNVKSKRESKKVAREEGIDLMEEMGEYKLYVVTKAEAAAKHFRETQWCVRVQGPFDNYGPPYYYFTKNDDPYTLLHLNSNQCMDIHDRDKELGFEEKEMMQTEKMTNYVIANDNSEEALATYSDRVGEGYDGVIEEYMDKKIDELIAQYDFKHYHLNTDNISDGYYSATGFITYDFSNLEDYFDDKKFQKLVKDALGYIDLYTEYLDADRFSEDGVSIDVEYDRSSDYYTSGKINELSSFLNEVSGYDSNYERHVEKFGEYLNERLLEAGFISSDWGTFKRRVLDKVAPTFKWFKSNMGGNKDSYMITFPLERSITVTSLTRIPRFSRTLDISTFNGMNTTGSQKLMYKFFKNIMDNCFSVKIKLDIVNENIMNTMVDVVIIYSPEYLENQKYEWYMNELKIMKSLDTHFHSYKKEIDNFFLWLAKNIDTVTGEEKIPTLTIRSRKSPKEQGYFQFKESKSFESLYNRIKLY